jgi:outer membrane protein assembly factor BamB
VSQRNLFAGVTIPQHPHLADNNWNSGHQDSYCSDSVGLTGPTSSSLRMIKQPNPFGFVPVMACNRANQMIGTAVDMFLPPAERVYELVVFDPDLTILAHRTVSRFMRSFAGGYFYLNSDDNAVVIDTVTNKIVCYPTANVAQGDPLDPLWSSADIVETVTGSATGNSLYAALPDWDDPALIWVLLDGQYELAGHLIGLEAPAYIAMVRITLDANEQDGATTELVDAMPLPGQWNNNTFAVDESGCYVVTNGVNAEGAGDFGFLHALRYDAASESIDVRWSYSYRNSGMFKPGHTNIGSGTTPTIMIDPDGRKLVAMTDNANPYLNAFVLEADTGRLVGEVPIFSKMRGANEASVIGVGNRLVAPNNFGHTPPQRIQTVPNEGGLVMIEVPGEGQSLDSDVVWEDTRIATLGMNMLARESGIIFAHTADWHDDVASVQGPMLYLSAIDAWDGRVIWRLPIGRGPAHIKDYGGQYFDRNGNVYLGTGHFLVAVQNAEA